MFPQVVHSSPSFMPFLSHTNKSRAVERVQAQEKIFLPPDHPSMADRLKIFRLNRKDWLSGAKWRWLGLKELIFTVGKQWYYRERQKHKKHMRALGPLLDRRPPVICTDFSLSRRHWIKSTHSHNILRHILILLYSYMYIFKCFLPFRFPPIFPRVSSITLISDQSLNT
jgi:hypothetical protein